MKKTCETCKYLVWDDLYNDLLCKKHMTNPDLDYGCNDYEKQQTATAVKEDRRKYNKPILINIEEKNGTIVEGYNFVWLERKWKKYRIGKIDYFNEWLPGIEKITIRSSHLSRSSYYRVRRLANEIEARLIIPSSCIVDI